MKFGILGLSMMSLASVAQAGPSPDLAVSLVAQNSPLVNNAVNYQIN